MDKFLYSPVKPFSLNQGFGQNLNAYYAQQGLKGHPGWDLRATDGQPVYASHDGQCFPQIDSHGGNGVRINSTTNSKEGAYFTIYWHLQKDDAVVHTFQMVKAGDLIGYADNTGESTGTHCHWAVCFLPQQFNNGYNGFTDPQPYFNGLYAEDIGKPPVPLLKYVFTRTLKQGNWNADVHQLQVVLQNLKFYNGVVDGDFGPKTKQAVMDFQKAHGLVSDGVVGLRTNLELNKI